MKKTKASIKGSHNHNIGNHHHEEKHYHLSERLIEMGEERFQYLVRKENQLEALTEKNRELITELIRMNNELSRLISTILDRDRHLEAIYTKLRKQGKADLALFCLQGTRKKYDS
jgi:hypothetical protein